MQGTYSRGRTPVLVVAVVAVALGASGAVQAASMEIWPSERRASNTFFCYGNDWNSMLIAIYPEDHGKHRLELPEQFTEPTVLTVTLPAAVELQLNCLLLRW